MSQLAGSIGVGLQRLTTTGVDEGFRCGESDDIVLMYPSHDYYQTMASFLLILQILVLGRLSASTDPWSKVEMPQKSYFMGFDAPRDQARWKTAILKAITGEQVLLERALRAVKTPNDFISTDERMNKVFQLNMDYILEGRKTRT